MNKKKIRKELFKSVYLPFFKTKNLIKKSKVKSITIDSSNIFIVFKNKLKFVLNQTDIRQTHLEAFSFGDYESYLTSLMCKILKNKKVNFFDIGANNGFVSLNVMQSCRNASAYCFEPNKNLFEELKFNSSINSIKNFFIFNFGLSDKAGNQKLYFDSNGSIGASLAKPKFSKKFINSKFNTLDNFVRLKKVVPYLIKCDVEGAELLVLKGGAATLKKYKPILFLEILRKWTKKFNYNSNDIINYLKKLDYICFKVSKKKIHRIDKINNKTIETNFLFINKKDEEFLKKLSR